MKRWLALLCLCIGVWPTSAQASITRFAVIIGNNRGHADDPELLFAEDDAARVHEVLRDLGGFLPENMLLLRGEDAQTVQRTLITVNDRVRAAVSLPEGKALLFVYYSGHADAEDLHLGSSRLPIRQFAELARGSAASFRLVVVDACRSGALTRLKGGKHRPKFDLPGEQMPEDGLAFLTAASVNEDAQESDLLRGSFFTHALVSGLLGAADRDANGEVTLDEAYHYAYGQTVRATSRTWSGTQHPAFRYDFRGRGAVVLTRPDAFAQQRVNVRLPRGLDVLLLQDGADGAVIAEVPGSFEQRSLSLRPGRYFARARGDEVLYEGPFSATPGATVTIDVAQLTRIDYAHLVRKGSGSLSWSQSLEVGARARTVIRNAHTPCVGAFLGYAFDRAQFGARARLSACTSGFSNANVRALTRGYDLDARIYHAWDLAMFSLEVGLGGGVGIFTQEFQSRGRAPSRVSTTPFVAVAAALAWELGWQGLYASLDVAAETHFMPLQTDAVSQAHNTAQPALRGSLGLGQHF
jgi:hypothetical protein